jgi:hypothetical protein
MGADSSLTTLCISALGRTRFRIACAASIIGLALAGCSDDDEPDTTGTQTPPVTAPERTDTAPERERTSTGGETGRTSPEDRPGGAGDEEAARSQALFTGRGGKIRPPRVQVPPFIAIRVELRSADGRPYGLRFGKRVVVVGGTRRSASLTLDGMRPGRRLEGSGTARVVIEASAEPGP